MTTQERIDSWKCDWRKDNVKLKMRNNIDWDKYGFKQAEVSINNIGNAVYIRTGIGGESHLGINLFSSYEYILELRSNDPDITCGAELDTNIEASLPIYYGYTKNLYTSNGIYELDNNTGTINFYETKRSDYIDAYLPNELRNIINNPLFILDDEELSTFIPTLVELFHLHGGEILFNAQMRIDECINTMQNIFNKIRMTNKSANNGYCDNPNDGLFLNRLRNEILNYTFSIKE